jgi:hypothetical protein
MLNRENMNMDTILLAGWPYLDNFFLKLSSNSNLTDRLHRSSHFWSKRLNGNNDNANFLLKNDLTAISAGRETRFGKQFFYAKVTKFGTFFPKCCRSRQSGRLPTTQAQLNCQLMQNLVALLGVCRGKICLASWGIHFTSTQSRVQCMIAVPLSLDERFRVCRLKSSPIFGKHYYPKICDQIIFPQSTPIWSPLTYRSGSSQTIERRRQFFLKPAS